MISTIMHKLDLDWKKDNKIELPANEHDQNEKDEACGRADHPCQHASVVLQDIGDFGEGLQRIALLSNEDSSGSRMRTLVEGQRPHYAGYKG